MHQSSDGPRVAPRTTWEPGPGHRRKPTRMAARSAKATVVATTNASPGQTAGHMSATDGSTTL